jgi:hypothetical protein
MAIIQTKHASSKISTNLPHAQTLIMQIGTLDNAHNYAPKELMRMMKLNIANKSVLDSILQIIRLVNAQHVVLKTTFLTPIV